MQLEVKPWDRQPRETAIAYDAFQRWVSLGIERTMTQVARETGRSHQAVSGWAKRWNWEGRLLAKEAELNRQREAALREDAEREALRWSRRQFSLRNQEWDVSQRLV